MKVILETPDSVRSEREHYEIAERCKTEMWIENSFDILILINTENLKFNR